MFREGNESLYSGKRMLSEPSLVTTADPGQKIVVQCQTGQAEIIDALAPAWSRLCDELQDAEPFFRPEWTRACHLAFFPDSEVILLSAWSAERLVAVMPLMKEKTWFSGLPVTRLGLVATVHSFRVGMVRREGAEGDEAVRAIWEAIRQIPEWDVFDIPYALEGGGLETLADEAREAGFPMARSRVWQSLHLPISPQVGTPKKTYSLHGWPAHGLNFERTCGVPAANWKNKARSRCDASLRLILRPWKNFMRWRRPAGKGSREPRF